MAIPFTILWKARLSRRHKLALIGLFSLVLFTIAAAIVRTGLGIRQQELGIRFDMSWNMVWFSVEVCIGTETSMVTKRQTLNFIAAIIVSCIGSFRTLFTKSRLSSTPAAYVHMLEDHPSSRARRPKLDSFGQEISGCSTTDAREMISYPSTASTSKGVELSSFETAITPPPKSKSIDFTNESYSSRERCSANGSP